MSWCTWLTRHCNQGLSWHDISLTFNPVSRSVRPFQNSPDSAFDLGTNVYISYYWHDTASSTMLWPNSFKSHHKLGHCDLHWLAIEVRLFPMLKNMQNKILCLYHLRYSGPWVPCFNTHSVGYKPRFCLWLAPRLLQTNVVR